ncbi:MAG TPA: phosphotriesterase-related protein [Candidatus Dormibacteraeota bacterium]|nr:phosphotriesterase-related protein [Candidatus Dormibacteraeota bacterium]
MTVRGPVAAQELGITLMHEHLFIDLSFLRDEPTWDWQKTLVDAELTLVNRGLLQVDPYVSRRNLVLDDVDAAVAELIPFRELGGGCVVDLTTTGIKPQPARLREVSERTGVHMVAGCGHYTRRSHSPEVAAASEAQLVEGMLDEIANGLAGTDVRPGIIGEIGTGSPIHPDEAKVLRAAAAAQQETGLAINVHVAIFKREALAALDVLEAAGADLSRVVISHLDEQPDTAYHRAVLERGAYVEYDTFGSESYFDGDGSAEPSDRERVDCLIELLDGGWGDRLLISQDVCTKVQLLRFGGLGYAHILRSIVPRLRRRGVDDATIRKLLVENPARVLAL